MRCWPARASARSIRSSSAASRPTALAGRIEDCESTFVITADEGVRGGKKIPLKANTDKALDIARQAIDRHRELRHRRQAHRRQDVAGQVRAATSGTTRKSGQARLPARVEMGAEDPLFILYTSGSTGKPKGVLHTTGGYLVWASMTINTSSTTTTATSSGARPMSAGSPATATSSTARLANGATTLMFEGVPTYPDASRFWEVDRQAQGQHLLHRADRDPRADGAGRRWEEALSRKSLRLLGSVGEPINPEAWEWYYRMSSGTALPDRRHLVADRNRRHLITPCPAPRLKPGSATKPFFGVKPKLVDDKGKVLEGATDGNLCITDSGRARCAPSMATTSASSTPISDLSRASTSPATAAAATRTAITGSPAASTTSSTSPATAWAPPKSKRARAHPKVAEAAVVGYPHDIKGQGIYAMSR
jgi:acetyl-CoA synthetase